MRTINLILISVLTISGVQAQSKKVINQTLRAQMDVVANTADSINAVHKVKQDEVRRLQNQMIELDRLSTERKRIEADLRSGIRYYHSLLKNYNFDPNTLVSLADVNAMDSPSSREGYLPDQTILTQIVLLSDKPTVTDVSEEKVKVQNQMLQNKVDEFKAVNAKNLKNLAAEDKLITDLKNAQKTFSKAIENYGLFNERLGQKQGLLFDKFQDFEAIKEEQERLKREKELALEAKKNKGKKPKSVEPEIIEMYYDREGGYEFGDNTKNAEFAPIEERIPLPPLEVSESPQILDVVEVPAEYSGGREAMMKFLDANLKMPAVAEELGINGKCYLRFVISENGNVSNVSVRKGVNDCPECDQEAIRVVKLMSDWIPAKNNGKAVNCWYTLPIAFKNQ